MKDALKGAILQRDKTTYAIVPRTPAGIMTPDQLESIAHVARRYEVPVLKITSGQRMALVGLAEQDVSRAWDDLRMEVGEATGLCVHYVQACPGTAVCRLGLRDSLGLGLELEKLYVGRELPAKVKMGVSGCPMCCGESWVRDIGFLGRKNGWTMIVGGSSAGRPRIGDLLAEGLDREQAVELAGRFLDYYAEQAPKRHRTAKFLEKHGIEAVKEALL